jgi:hypothetical protein
VYVFSCLLAYCLCNTMRRLCLPTVSDFKWRISCVLVGHQLSLSNKISDRNFFGKSIAYTFHFLFERSLAHISESVSLVKDSLHVCISRFGETQLPLVHLFKRSDKSQAAEHKHALFSCVCMRSDSCVCMRSDSCVCMRSDSCVCMRILQFAHILIIFRKRFIFF